MTKVDAPFSFELRAPVIEIRIPKVNRCRRGKCGFIAEVEVPELTF